MITMVGLFLIFPFFQEPAKAVSSDNYLQLAHTWAQSGIFPDSYYGPIYIVYVSLFSRAHHAIQLIILSQVLLSVTTACVVYRIAWRVTKRQSIAILATALFLASPLRIIYQGMVLTETLYVFLLYLGIYLLITSESALRSACSGLIVAMAALTRGNGLIVGVLLFPYLLRRVRMTHIRPYLYMAFFAIPITMWSWNNHMKYQTFKPTASGDYNLAANIVGPEKRLSMGLPQEGNANIWKIPGETFNNTFHEGKTLRSRAMDFARQHPARIAFTNIVGWIKSIAGSGLAQWSLTWGIAGKLIAIAGSALRVSLYGVSLFWIARRLRQYRAMTKRDASLIFFFTAIFAAHIIPGGASGYSRFSLPVDPIAIIVAAVAIHDFIKVRIQRAPDVAYPSTS